MLNIIKLRNLTWQIIFYSYSNLVNLHHLINKATPTRADYRGYFLISFSIFIQDLLERETKNQEKYEKEKGRLVKFTEVCLTSVQSSKTL